MNSPLSIEVDAYYINVLKTTSIMLKNKKHDRKLVPVEEPQDPPIVQPWTCLGSAPEFQGLSHF